MPTRRTVRSAFTLIEVLVVIAIIAVLIGLLLSAVQKVRESAARTKCAYNLRQLGVALTNYEQVHHKYPWGCCSHQVNQGARPGMPASEQQYVWFGWQVLLLPYVEQDNLLKGFDLGFGYTPGNPPFQYGPFAYANGNRNLDLSATVLQTYLCPSDSQAPTSMPGQGGGKRDLLQGRTNYAGVADSTDRARGNRQYSAQPDDTYYGVGNGVLMNAGFQKMRIGMDDVPDGLSNTFFVTEVTGDGERLGGEWCVGKLVDLKLGITRPVKGSEFNYIDTPVSSYHMQGANFLMGDGTVRFVKASADRLVLQAAATRAGREVNSGDD